jgi:hypothetical protein
MPYIMVIKGSKEKSYTSFKYTCHAREFARRNRIQHYKLVNIEYVKGKRKK